MAEVLSYDPERRTNAALMVDCRTLGYLDDQHTILDTTFGQGGFWKEWTPVNLIANDLDPMAASNFHYDFTALPWDADSFDVVVFDPPYKLNGTSAHPSDKRYGVGGKYQSVAAKLDLITRGCEQAARVARERVLVKCQDQVVSGRIVWQTHLITRDLSVLGWALVDRLEVHGHRPQPPGRRQVHSRRTTSSLLVFEPWQIG